MVTRPATRSLLLGVGGGLLTGLVLRFCFSHGWEGFGFSHGWEGFLALMSLTFLVLVPAVMGFVTVFVMERGAPRRWVAWVFAPFIPVVLALVITMLFNIEGLICVVMLLPVALLAGAIGGVIGGFVARGRTRAGHEVLGVALVLPLVLGVVESRAPSVRTVHEVRSAISIRANPERVWAEIARVPAIAPDELPALWTHRIGFPRPLEATLSHEGAGAVRHATFEHGVSFLENVDIWEPGHRLAFGIRAESVPSDALDEHVTIGGAYFDVLRGQYVLEPGVEGGTRLVLTSTHRLSTHFNPYAALWVDAVMSDIQRGILDVVRRRAETAERVAR